MTSCSIATSFLFAFNIALLRCYCWYQPCLSCSTCQATWSGCTCSSAKWWRPTRLNPHRWNGSCSSSSCYSITPISALISCCIRRAGPLFVTVSVVSYAKCSSVADSAKFTTRSMKPAWKPTTSTHLEICYCETHLIRQTHCTEKHKRFKKKFEKKTWTKCTDKSTSNVWNIRKKW